MIGLGALIVSDTRQYRNNGKQPASDLSTWDELRLAFRLYRDPRVSSMLKWFVPIVAALYVISPVDLIPDFLLGVGQVDDLGVIGVAMFAAFSLIRRLAPKSVVAEHLSAMGRPATPSPGPASSHPSGDVFDTTFRVTNDANQRNDRHHQRTATDGRRVA
jgi:uncharacterized membrane protein YkvA (DUF1232 family)